MRSTERSPGGAGNKSHVGLRKTVQRGPANNSHMQEQAASPLRIDSPGLYTLLAMPVMATCLTDSRVAICIRIYQVNGAIGKNAPYPRQIHWGSPGGSGYKRRAVLCRTIE